MKNIDNKKILLIICGGISAYKSLEIIRLLKKGGMNINDWNLCKKYIYI